MLLWIEDDRGRRIAERRRRNPVREARRQAHLTRMLRRVVDYVPMYRDIRNSRGEIVGARYLGHRAVLATRGVR